MASLTEAENMVEKLTGDRVTFGDYPVNVIKFGRNNDIGTGSVETVWQTGGTETYPTGNTIDSITSTSGSDTAVVVTLVGHTLAGGLFTRVEQDVTLTGQTAATLTTPLARVERGYVSGSAAAVGTVYVWESGGGSSGGVPTVAADIHMTITALAQQSEKCAFTVPDGEWLLIQQIEAGILGSSTASADLGLQVRLSGGVWRERFTFSARTSGTSQPVIPFVSPFLVAPNSDIRVVAEASAVNTEIIATLQGSFGLVIS